MANEFDKVLSEQVKEAIVEATKLAYLQGYNDGKKFWKPEELELLKGGLLTKKKQLNDDRLLYSKLWLDRTFIIIEALLKKLEALK